MVFVRFDFLIYGKIYFDFVVVAVAAVEVVVVDVERYAVSACETPLTLRLPRCNIFTIPELVASYS